MKRHKHFYHHLIEIDSIHLALDDLELTPEEKHDLIIIVDDNIDHTVLDTVLSELESGDKKAFLALVVAQDHNEIWDLLSDKVENVEEKIKKAVNTLISKLHEDIREAHKKKKNHS
jgi:hypothetical protein